MKALTREESKTQIGRLGQMKGFPRWEPAAVGELVDALLLNGEEPVDEDLAKKVIGDMIRNAASDTECPMPRDIREAITSHLEEKRWDPECAKCQGTGGIPTKMRGMNGEIYNASRTCDCLARRPAPVWEKMPDNPTQDIAEAVRKAVIQ